MQFDYNVIDIVDRLNLISRHAIRLSYYWYIW